MRFAFRNLCCLSVMLIPLASCSVDVGDLLGPCDPARCVGVVCDDGNECTYEGCYCGECLGPYDHPDETECAFEGRPGLCVDGTCEENLCVGVSCESDENECTRDCNHATGACDYAPMADTTPCQDFVCPDGVDCNETPPYCFNGACTLLIDQCTANDLALLAAGDEPRNSDLVNECLESTKEPLGCSGDDVNDCYQSASETRLTSGCTRCLGGRACEETVDGGYFHVELCQGDY